MTLRLIATETVKAHVGAFRGRAGDGYFKMTNGFLEQVEKHFGREVRNALLAWITTVWNELHGPTWDWFAYRFAFNAWFNNHQSGAPTAFDPGARAAETAVLFDSMVRTPLREFREITQRYRGLRLSTWDRTVFELSQWRLSEMGPEETGDIFALLYGPVATFHFQEFWMAFLAIMVPEALVRLHSATEELAKRELSFPPRNLLRPTELPLSPR
jgi:hypothetical protein